MNTKTNKDRTGALSKHCMLGNCNSKLITGGAWSRHLEKVHPLIEKVAANFIACAGASCNACDKGKYLG
jgi:hypothetical protein